MFSEADDSGGCKGSTSMLARVSFTRATTDMISLNETDPLELLLTTQEVLPLSISVVLQVQPRRRHKNAIGGEQQSHVDGH